MYHEVCDKYEKQSIEHKQKLWEKNKIIDELNYFRKLNEQSIKLKTQETEERFTTENPESTKLLVKPMEFIFSKGLDRDASPP